MIKTPTKILQWKIFIILSLGQVEETAFTTCAKGSCLLFVLHSGDVCQFLILRWKMIS